MEAFLESLNSRELSVFLWTFVLLSFSLSSSKIRKPIRGVATAFLHPKIVAPVVILLFYTAAIVFAFYRVGLWTPEMLKDTILWSLGVGVVLLIKSVTECEPDDFFRQTVRRSIGVTVALEFLVNVYVFPFWIEFLAVPVIGVLAILKAISETDRRYASVDRALGCLLSAYGLTALTVSLVRAASNLQSFATLANLRALFIPVLLTIASVPFIYLFALVVQYEEVFIRLRLNNNDSEILRFAKWRILRKFHFRLGRLKRWSKRVGLLSFPTKADVENRLGED